MKFKKKNGKNTTAENADEILEKEKDEDVKKPNEKVMKIKAEVRKFVTKYKIALLGFAGMIVLTMIGSMITADERGIISEKQQGIIAIDTEYQRLQRTAKDSIKAYESASLDTARWKNDDKYVLNLITDAFAHKSPTEYKNHREKYSYLDFNITDLQKDYFENISGPVYNGAAGESRRYLGDASDLISSSIVAYTSYVSNVDADSYSYVAIITVAQDEYDTKAETIKSNKYDIALTYECKNPVNEDINYSVDVVDMTAFWVKSK